MMYADLQFSSANKLNECHPLQPPADERLQADAVGLDGSCPHGEARGASGSVGGEHAQRLGARPHPPGLDLRPVRRHGE